MTDLEKGGLEVVRETLNKTGCGFCLAKWTQVTIHLQTGMTHSCHHPSPHKIPLNEIKRNPTALHNTMHKKRARKEMLEGNRPKECDYCWNIEDSSDQFSDRTFKSNEEWSKPYMEEIKGLGWRDDYNPKYVEVSFSNVCNFKCSYCGPAFSSQWMQESKKFGPYPTFDDFGGLKYLEEQGVMPYNHKEHNPYVEAFWKWWPDLYNDLHTFRITGGEPLLSQDTWRILDYILNTDNPNPNLKLAINTNLGIPDDLYNRFLEKVKQLENSGRIKEFTIFTSAESTDGQADYIRHGLDFTVWRNRIDEILTETNRTAIAVMATYNALSVPRYIHLMEWVFAMKKKHNNPQRYWISALTLDSAYLRYPNHQTVKILPDNFRKYIIECIEYAEKMDTIYPREEIEVWKNYYTGFTGVEIAKIKRILDWFDSKDPEHIVKRNRKDFYNFVNTHDKRRNTNFVETFPEFEEFYLECGKLNKDDE